MAECDDPLQRCLQGNLFRADMPRSNVIVEGAINGMRTGPLPNGEVFKLENTLKGTTSRADILLAGTQFPIIDNLGELNISRPEDVGITVNEIPVPDSSASGSLSEIEDALVLQVPAALVGSAPPPGDFDIDTAPEQALWWIATTVVTSLEIIDENAGLSGLYAWSHGYLDLRLTGTDTSPVLAELANLIRNNDIRSGLRALMRGGAGIFRIGINSANVLFVAFRHSRLLGSFVAGAAATLARSRATTVVAGIKGALDRSASAAKGAPVIGFIIVGVVDFLEWYADPSKRGDWANLVAVLAVDMVALTISTIVGGMAAGVAAFMLGTAAATIGGILLIAAAGIGTGLLVGVAITALANLIGLTPIVERGLEWVSQGAVTLMERVTEWANDAAHFVTHANPGDGRITGPTDYLMEIDRGIMDYINRQLGLP